MESIKAEAGTAARAPMDHVRALAEEIGPRGSTGPGEARAAEYVMGEFARMGLAPERLPFRSPVSAWRPFAMLTALSIAGIFLVMSSAGRTAWLAAGIALNGFALKCSMLQLIRFDSPISRFLRRRLSSNALARIRSSGAPTSTILVTAHYDTHRTPMAYSSPGWVAAFRAFTTMGMASYAITIPLAIALMLIDPTSRLSEILRAGAMAPLLIQLLIFGISLEADKTPYTPGANDNASGVAALLGVGERLAARPLAGTEVWLLATGCEEVGLIGMREFMRERGPKSSHPERLPRPEEAAVYQINIDNIGGEGLGPRYIDGEKMLVNFRSDAGLLALADKITAERPELDARRMSYQGAYTDGAIGVINGLRVITFLGLRDDGWIPNLHQMTDTADKVDPRAIDRTIEFIEELARRIDEGSADRLTAQTPSTPARD